MYRFDYRMVEGPPLHYYHPYTALDVEDRFPNFRLFETYSTRTEMNEEILMPASPNSTQSDSENSVSSIEIPQKELRLPSIIKTHEKSDVQCRWRSCGIFFSSLDQLANHVSNAHAASGLGGLFYCDWEGCTRNNKGFNARYKMLVHVRTHTNEKPHKCFQCDKSFSRAENLKIHSRSHSGEKPYACPMPGCTKAYSNSSDRFKHTRTHQVDKPYQCKVPGCPKRYTDPSSLRKHVKTYKHFVNERDLEATRPSETRVEEVLTESQPLYRENVIRHPCDCNRVCCVTNCLRSSPEFFKIGSFIDVKSRDDGLSTWNRYIEPHIGSQVGGYEEDMQVDVPLDLNRTAAKNPTPGCTKANSNSSDRLKHTRNNQVDKPYQCKVPGCPKHYTDPRSLREHVKTYKHFVNERDLEATRPPRPGPKMVCCVTNCLRSSPEFFKIGSFIDVKSRDDGLSTWNRYIEPHIGSQVALGIVKTYKHFVYDNDNRRNLEATRPSEEVWTGSQPLYRKNRSPDYFKFGSFIDVQGGDDILSTWNRYTDPQIGQAGGYEEDMQFDLPLDLSLYRRDI
ncbi:unnamed protein product [Phaedon cochleariae]|uniref:C2H2-type domain-containing protein n=1 Tax=Phaedon cochleariae TaxID=80249 RepID=A0A9N9SGX2_PHACE|nr:unnamed protein product [Phaedon cochleariae]